jgi:hypothetical protein
MTNDDDDTITCPACSGIAAQMGTLGNRVYFRCQNCGLDASFLPEPTEITKVASVKSLSKGMEAALAQIAAGQKRGVNASSVRGLKARGLVAYRPGTYDLVLTHAGICYIQRSKR